MATNWDDQQAKRNKVINILNQLNAGGTDEDRELANQILAIYDPYKTYYDAKDAEWAALDTRVDDLMNQAISKGNQFIEQQKPKWAQQKQQALERESRESGIAEREASAKQAQTQARAQGQSRGLASSLGNVPLSGYSAENTANNYGRLADLGQSTQNDYLMKMGYANALDQQAKNMEAGSFLNTLGAIFGGAGTGMGAGNAIT